MDLIHSGFQHATDLSFSPLDLDERKSRINLEQNYKTTAPSAVEHTPGAPTHKPLSSVLRFTVWRD